MSRTENTAKLEAVIRDLTAHSHEEEWFEFKTNRITDHEIGEYISALSNAAALVGQDVGYLVWGIENNTHCIIGTSFDYDRLGENVPVEPPNVPVNVPVKDQNVPVRTSNKSDIEERILVFCSEPKGIMEIAGLLGYGDKRTVRKYINPLLETGRLAMTVPDKPNSSKQKYITIK